VRKEVRETVVAIYRGVALPVEQKGLTGAPFRVELLEVQRRPLTPAETGRIMVEIRRSGAITGYSAAEWRGKRDVFALVGRDSGELVAAVLVHHLWGGWSELAVVFVLEAHRGKGHAKTVIQSAMRTLRSDGRRKVIFFCDDKMRHLSQASGFAVFDSEDDYLDASPRDRFFFRISYKVQWLANAYRIRELRRKRREMGSVYAFKMGVRHP
jgi:GNAT superfamily N-acetyltransferase